MELRMSCGRVFDLVLYPTGNLTSDNAVYSTHECLGWYSTGSSYEPIHRFVHEQVRGHDHH